MQGLVAYYYDHVRINNAVELNQCKFNHMGVDVTHNGKCRNGLSKCEDCMKTKLDEVYSVHYTTCRKPWQCQATGAPRGNKVGGGRGSAINTDMANLDHCLDLVREWHSMRSDLENMLFGSNKEVPETLYKGTHGSYKRDVFQGHCENDGDDFYIPLGGNATTTNELVEQVRHLYV